MLKDGVELLRLRVSPGAGRSEITGCTGGVWQVKVAAPPVEGKANRELIAFLGRTLGISKSSVSIVKGQTSRNKLIAVAGMSRDVIIARLSA